MLERIILSKAAPIVRDYAMRNVEMHVGIEWVSIEDHFLPAQNLSECQHILL